MELCEAFSRLNRGGAKFFKRQNNFRRPINDRNPAAEAELKNEILDYLSDRQVKIEKIRQQSETERARMEQEAKIQKLRIEQENKRHDDKIGLIILAVLIVIGTILIKMSAAGL